MGYQEIDKELAHLEVVFGLISTRDRFPLAYWHRRLRALQRESMMQPQRERVARLEATLRSLAAKEAKEAKEATEEAEEAEEQVRPRR